MQRRKHARRVAAAVLVCAYAVMSAPARDRAGADILLSLRASIDSDGELRALCEEYGFTLRHSAVKRGFAAVRVPDGMSVAAAEALLALDSRVAGAEPDARIYPAFMPTDPLFERQWALFNPGNDRADIKALEAWEMSRGRRRVIIGIIDSGIQRDHPDLASNIWRNQDEVPGNGRDDDGNGYVDDTWGWDFVENTNNPADRLRHGTLMAGIVGARAQNGIGIAGIMHDAALMSVKGLGDFGFGFASDLIAGIYYAVDNGALVINASWGSGAYRQTMRQAIAYAASRGVIFVAAAGNARRDNDIEPFYPASYGVDNVISVAASTIRDSLAGFSHYGRHSVDIAAPGVAVISTTTGGRYLTTSGTSMAAPHVAGCVGLLLSYAPGLQFGEYINAVLNSADRLPQLEGKCMSGGRLNAYRALRQTVAMRTDMRFAIHYMRMKAAE